jgi:hypothetical protein
MRVVRTSKHRASSFYSSVGTNRGKVKCCIVAVNITAFDIWDSDEPR